MKTVYKSYNWDQARAKQVELEAKTGVKWDFYHTSRGYCFTAIVTKRTSPDVLAGKALLQHLPSRVSRTFDRLADDSGMDLAAVLEGAQWLVRTQQVRPDVNRNGNLAAIWRK